MVQILGNWFGNGIDSSGNYDVNGHHGIALSGDDKTICVAVYHPPQVNHEL